VSLLSLLNLLRLLYRALDLLFKFFTSWCLRIVPPLFLRDLYRACSSPTHESPPKTPHYSPMLHNALVSLALAFLDEPQFNDIKVRQQYANMAKSFIEPECRKPNLSVVHALSMLASFHSSQGDQTLGYMYFGMNIAASFHQCLLNSIVSYRNECTYVTSMYVQRLFAICSSY